jgi:hypothetical protein
MRDLISRQGDHPDLKLKPEALLFELEHGGYAANIAIIDRLDRQASADALQGLANLLITQKNRIANRGTGLVASHLASVLAFWSRGASSAISDLAYELLLGQEREFRMQLIYRHASMADLLQLAPSNLKSFWRQQLLGYNTRESWDTPDGQQAIRWIQHSSLNPHTYQTLIDLIPADLTPAFKRKVHAPMRAPLSPESNTPSWDQGPSPQQTFRPKTVRKSRSLKFSIRYIAIIIALANAVLRLSNCSDSSPSEQSLPTRRLEPMPNKPSQHPFLKPTEKADDEPAPPVNFRDLLSDPAGQPLINPDSKPRPENSFPRK